MEIDEFAFLNMVDMVVEPICIERIFTLNF